ncbi:hypothetical protein JRC04_04970 [Mycolicibacterium sp. S2-37]|uniref:hypothetical protein n=1 Tax=Mycolicibacterium sp. S2-37 TaxID=2810297 RepID=UPI001A954300|nr:hypothetical protein [Mycolicibacterium sp. S2-37]MBO0676809.1 hypothetical protein [Mycolicibacterium sp. S2-37]
MKITTAINEAKNDLDHASGELQRLELLLQEQFVNSDAILVTDYERIMETLSVAASKVKRVRASL